MKRCDLYHTHYLSHVNGGRGDTAVLLQYQMKQQITIAIIGATEMAGSGLLRYLLHSECHLLLLANDQHELRRISKMLKTEKPIAGISLIDCIKDGCWEADVVILAVAAEKESEVAARIREVVTQKIVISMEIADTIPGKSLSALLPNSKVVYASQLKGADGHFQFVISGNDEGAVKEANELLNALNIRHNHAA